MINGRTYATSYNDYNPTPTPDPPSSKTTAATEIYNFFREKGWSKNAICGFLEILK